VAISDFVLTGHCVSGRFCYQKLRRRFAVERMLKSLDTDGIFDPQTGLLTSDSFWRDLKKVMAESADRSLPLSVSFFIRQHNRRTCQTRCHTIDDPVDPQYRLCGAR
jgi:hypothetical protein